MVLRRLILLAMICMLTGCGRPGVRAAAEPGGILERSPARGESFGESPAEREWVGGSGHRSPEAGRHFFNE